MCSGKLEWDLWVLGLGVAVFFDECEQLLTLIRGKVFVIEEAQHESRGRAAEDAGDEVRGHPLGDFFLTDFRPEKVGIPVGLTADIFFPGHDVEHRDEGGVGEIPSGGGKEFADLADAQLAAIPEDFENLELELGGVFRF